MNEKYTIYTLNENCIADSLTADLGEKQRLAVPHLSVLNGAFSDITNGRTDVLVAGDFLDDGRLSVWYDENTKKMYLGGKNQNRERVISLDCSPFIVDGMINSVSVVNEDPTTTPPTHGVFIEIIWNTDSGHAPTYINVKNVIGGLYTGDGKYINVDENLSISFDSGKFIKNFKENSDGLSNTYDTLYKNYQFLAGLDGDYTSGAIGQMSSDIENLKDNGINGLKYLKDIDDAVELGASDSLSSFLQSEIGDSIENGTYLPVKFDEDTTVELDDGLKVCNGDVVIIHVDGNTRYIPVESIKLGINASVQKGGVSRYEYNENKDNISQLRTDVDAISNDVSSISGDVEEISGKVDNKIFIVNPDVNLSDYSDLSVVKLGKEEYETLIASEDSLDPRTIYIVNSDVIDAYGQKIQNVFDASDLSDAVNLKQLQNSSGELRELVENKISNLSTEKEVLSSENGGVSVLTEINETSGVISIKKSRLEKSMVNDLVETLDELCAGLSTKIYIYSPDDNLSDYSDLSVVKIGKSEYEQLIAGENDIDPRVLYVVNSDVIDAYGQQIKNISGATDLSDAVILEQLQQVSNDLKYEISGISSNVVFIPGEGDGSARQKQATNPTQISISENNAFSFATTVEGAGNKSGLKAFRYSSIGPGANQMTFETAISGWAENDVVSFVNKNKYQDTSIIQSINGNVVTFDSLPFNEIIEESDYDSKTAYVSTKPDVGNIDLGIGAHSEGINTKAINSFAHAEGFETSAVGQYSHAEGKKTKAYYASHAEGDSTQAKMTRSHAEGIGSIANGNFSHAEGGQTLAGSGTQPTVRGDDSADGVCAHAEGNGTWAKGSSSHSEGKGTKAEGAISHAEGSYTKSIGLASHSEGINTVAGDSSKVAAYNDSTKGYFTHAEGNGTLASGNSAHAEGNGTLADGPCSHSEGFETSATGNCSHTEGSTTEALGTCTHAEGYYSQAIGNCSHAEGGSSEESIRGGKADGVGSHAEGINSTASGKGSHAEGCNTTAGNYAHAEGYGTKANGYASHAEGEGTEANSNGTRAHAEGIGTLACGLGSHSEGGNTVAGNGTKKSLRGEVTIGYFSHSEGNGTIAKGNSSHAEGKGTETQNQSEHAQGQFNISHKLSDDFGLSGNTIHTIGIGSNANGKKNSVEVMQNGDLYVISVGGYDGINLAGNTLQQTISDLSGRVDKQKIVDYYNSNNLSGYNRDQWLGLNLHQMGEMLSVLFTAFCK